MYEMPRIDLRKDALDSASPYAIYTRALQVDGRKVLTDQEGYILDMDIWIGERLFTPAPRSQASLTCATLAPSA